MEIEWITMVKLKKKHLKKNFLVNFDFQCKCSARSTIAKNLQVPTDANQVAQQTIQQLQEQIKRLNDQIQRASSGKTSFEQFGLIFFLIKIKNIFFNLI